MGEFSRGKWSTTHRKDIKLTRMAKPLAFKIKINNNDYEGTKEIKKHTAKLMSEV